MQISPKKAMWMALEEAKKGRAWVEPNPPVGCVILDSEYRFLSSGYHKSYGLEHAEVHALQKIKDKKKLKGAHIFVTLEPCHHQGKTAPCSKELASYYPASLTYGAKDPFTHQRGLEYLKKKNIRIIYNTEFKEEIEDLLAVFKFHIKYKSPFVSLKIASSLDSVIAFKNKKWITDLQARKHGHFLRAFHTAVLIGVDTFIKDKPRLNIRYSPFKKKTNKVIILDPKGQSLSLLPGSALMKTHLEEDIIVCVSDKCNPSILKSAKNSCGKIKVLSKKFFISPSRNKVAEKVQKPIFHLSSVLRLLYKEEQIYSVLVEGGAFCWTQFLEQKRAQKLYLYLAPQIMGEGLFWPHLFSPRFQSVNFKSKKITSLGPDLLWTLDFC